MKGYRVIGIGIASLGILLGAYSNCNANQLDHTPLVAQNSEKEQTCDPDDYGTLYDSIEEICIAVGEGAYDSINIPDIEAQVNDAYNHERYHDLMNGNILQAFKIKCSVQEMMNGYLDCLDVLHNKIAEIDYQLQQADNGDFSFMEDANCGSFCEETAVYLLNEKSAMYEQLVDKNRANYNSLAMRVDTQDMIIQNGIRSAVKDILENLYGPLGEM